MPPRKPELVLIAPDGQRTPMELSSAPIRVGRADHCDYVLGNDAEVSREHAEIWIDELSRVLVEDKGSKNGTRVDNGEVFRSDTRFAFESIRIGEHDIRISGAARPDGKQKPDVMFTPDASTRMGDTQFFPSSRGLDLSKQRLAALIQLTERIGGVFNRPQLLEEALDVCCQELGFERGLIALKTQRGDTEAPITRNVKRDEHGAYTVSRTLINRALIDGERAIVNNPATDLAGNLSESLVRFPICSALCVPILYRGEVLGVIYGDRVTQGSTYQPADVDFLAAIAQQVGVGISNLRLFQEHVRSQRMYAELEQARVIQQTLLPDKMLNVGRVRIEGLNEPSSAVSGDYFDYFDLGDGRVGMIIADVTGHGLPAALVMANLQSAIRVALTPGERLPELCRRVNALICNNTGPGVFVTGILGVIDTREAQMQYVVAGHPPPILLTTEGPKLAHIAEELGSLPLGIDPQERFPVLTISADDGVCGMLFYTDGIIEAEDTGGRLLGATALTRALDGLPERTPSHMIRAAREVVRKHQSGPARTDDMTLLAVTFESR